MNRLDQKLKELKQEKRSGLVCYFTAGDPDFSESCNLFSQLGQAGADIIEIGIPFSDPVADGEIIQAAHIRALSADLLKLSHFITNTHKKTEGPRPLRSSCYYRTASCYYEQAN